MTQDLFNYDGYINTASGIKFSLFDPKPEQISIYDIAKGLSNQGHFGGQTNKFFSISQHSNLVMRLLPSDSDIELKKIALFHDTSEAYLGDMIKPLKINMPFFQDIENNLLKVIFKKFNLDFERLIEIKPYDKLAQIMEFEQFYEGKNHFYYRDPKKAFIDFLTAYDYLFKKNTLKLYT